MNGKGLIPEAWLLDAPLFIDAEQVASLYNAVALPEFEEEARTIAASTLKMSKWTAGGQIEISAADSVLAKLLAPISAKGTAEGTREGEAQHGREQTITLRPVATPERQLLNLAVHYGANLQERVWTVQGTGDVTWLDDPDFASDLPRALVFLDVEPGTPIVPMAAELKDGKVILFYDQISTAAQQEGLATSPPDYPRTDGQEMNDYWNWFYQNHEPDSSILVMRVVEDVVGNGGRPQWVNYRLPIGAPGSRTRSLHLNIKSRGKYDTGDFAYELLRRGKRHGVRVVGTLKSGPALNVLAIFEK